MHPLQERYAPYLPDYPDAWVTIAYGRPNSTEKFVPRAVQLKNLQQMVRLIETDWKTYNIWTSMAISRTEPANGKTRKEDILGTRYLWVDCDTYKLPARHRPTEEQVIEALGYFQPPASQVVSSGRGYYGLWLLDSLVTDIEQIESRNRGIANALRDLGSDGCWNVDRVLRLPNTINTRSNTPVRILADSSEPRQLEAFPTSNKQRSAPLSDLIPEPLPPNFEDNLKRDNPRLWDRIVNGRGSDIPVTDSGVPDRSSNDFQVACILARHPYLFTPGQLATVLTHPTWINGDKYNTHGWSYVDRTIRGVMDSIADTKAVGQVETFSAQEFARSIQSEWYVKRYYGQLYRYDDTTGKYRVLYQDEVALFLERTMQKRLQVHHVEQTYKMLGFLVDKVVATHDETEHGAANQITVLEPQWVNVEDGLYNLNTGVLIDHTPSVFTIDQIPVSLNTPVRQADLDRLDTFVNNKLRNDPELISLWWQFVGHTLWGETIAPGILHLWGAAGSGKSAMLDLVTGFLGEKNVAAVNLPDIAENSYGAADLIGKRANVYHDISTDQAIRSDYLKAICEGAAISVRRIYQDPVKYKCTGQLFFTSNPQIRVRSLDEGWLRRLYSIECSDVWSPEREGFVARIGKVLISDDGIRAAMFQRALEGLTVLRERGDYTRPEAVLTERDELRLEQDSVYSFWVERTEPAADPDEFIIFDTLYQRYVGYCETTSRRHPYTKQRFGSRTKELCGNGKINVVKETKWVDGKAQVIYIGRQWTTKPVSDVNNVSKIRISG